MSVASLAVLAVGIALVWRNDILRALLDPQVPFDVHAPPPPPDYRRASAWALLPGPAGPNDLPVDVFFIHPTTFNGGKEWNGPIDDRRSARLLARVMLPNYAAPFARVGRVFAPRYRQASLYTSFTLFDDALEARAFAWRDIDAAFAEFRDHLNNGRPFILVGVEQGGLLAMRLLDREIAADPTLKGKLVAAYAIETVVPADEHGPGAAIPACYSRAQAGCLVAWVSVRRPDFMRAIRILDRATVWDGAGRLIGLQGREALCVNPLLGRADDADAPARLGLGAANATGLEWGARPGFLARQVEARCEGGVLRVSRGRSSSLRPRGDWTDRLKVPGYNVFWADLEADAMRRATAWDASAARSER
ncbi:MAG: DUF3089 domain-containing protein [Caulobacteraceae bacterium]